MRAERRRPSTSSSRSPSMARSASSSSPSTSARKLDHLDPARADGPRVPAPGERAVARYGGTSVAPRAPSASGFMTPRVALLDHERPVRRATTNASRRRAARRSAVTTASHSRGRATRGSRPRPSGGPGSCDSSCEAAVPRQPRWSGSRRRTAQRASELRLDQPVAARRCAGRRRSPRPSRRSGRRRSRDRRARAGARPPRGVIGFTANCFIFTICGLAPHRSDTGAPPGALAPLRAGPAAALLRGSA